MGLRVSVFLDHLGLLDPNLPGFALHGANMATVQFFHGLLRAPEVDAFEVFLPSAIMIHPQALAAAAQVALPEERRGKGVLAFYPIYTAPRVWADGAPRVLFCLEPDRMAPLRVLRDKFAKGPMPIVSDTHAMGAYQYYADLAPYARMSHVPFDEIVALSPSAESAFRATFEDLGALPCKLDVIPRAVDLAKMRPPTTSERTSAKEKLGLPADSNVALYFGRVNPYAKADLLPLISCFAKVAGPSDYLIIAGPPDPPNYAEALQREAVSLGVEKKVHVLGRIEPDDRSSLFHAADFSVFPADCTVEQLGNVAIESMACGLPVVATDWDGLRASIVDGETGILIPTSLVAAQDEMAPFAPFDFAMTHYLFSSTCATYSHDDLANALKRMFTEPDQRARMSANARARVERHYDFRDIFARHLANFQTLIDLASKETEAEKTSRQAGSEGRLPTIRYSKWFASYATEVDPLDGGTLALSEQAQKDLEQGKPPKFYEELLVIIRPEVLELIFSKLRKGPQPLPDLTEEISKRSGAPASEIRFHLAILLKRGAVTRNLNG